ncbi:hypothetical protein [Dactylosporangium sp. CA-139066]|uniref:hypothetical protein n=1 Tax=Dactylosporangium sp. CA-139066 TaxID=3239930 RepID=UPI003D89E350
MTASGMKVSLDSMSTPWGTEPEHAVEAILELTRRHGHAPNANMLLMSTKLPKGVLHGNALDAAERVGLVHRVTKFPDGRSAAFGGCRDAYVVSTPAQTKKVLRMNDIREILAEVLPKAAHKKIPELAERLAELYPDSIEVVDIEGARVAVETVEAYGLEIEVDALGRASAVYFPNGASVAA